MRFAIKQDCVGRNNLFNYELLVLKKMMFFYLFFSIFFFYLYIYPNSRKKIHDYTILTVTIIQNIFLLFLRHLFGPKKDDQTGEYKIRSNNEIKSILGKENIIQTLQEIKMSWLGHVWSSSGTMKDALNWKPVGKRPLGRPKKRWIDQPNQIFRILRIDNPEELANDREE